MRIDIIGAGPAGSYAAYNLAKLGHKVKVYERDSDIGKPVQCTGILSDYFESLMKPDPSFVLNTVDKTRIYAPNGRFVEAKIKKNFVICRKKFDNYVANLAKKEGVEYTLNASYKNHSLEAKGVASRINLAGKEIISKADALVGADGPNSEVARSAGILSDRKFIIGTQVEAKLKNDNVVEFYPYIGVYAWIVPVTSTSARIGVAAYKRSSELFKEFTLKRAGKLIPIENQSGVIPIFNPRQKAQKGRVYLIGDAATFNKATSGGGINQALKAAKILAECIDRGEDYDKAWRKEMFLNLYAHYIMHRMMLRFSEKDWNRLVEIFSQEKMKKLLFSESRDRVVSMGLRAIFTEPRLFAYARRFPFEDLRYLI
ncbi:MAG: NAD(P)/FAD-dependent oxidoreductase [Nanoarchaeota archaeon]|nr:NAD(P)/FAD-dependent oxidoreductase [Nanoarchaeota archaeon]